MMKPNSEAPRQTTRQRLPPALRSRTNDHDLHRIDKHQGTTLYLTRYPATVGAAASASWFAAVARDQQEPRETREPNMAWR